jgi:hypothetical protein
MAGQSFGVNRLTTSWEVVTNSRTGALIINRLAP